MAFSVDLFPAWLWMGAWLPFALLLLVVAWQAPWRCLKNPLAMNLVMGAGLAILLLWRVQAEAGAGLELHFLGVTALTLLLGWPFAVMVVAMVATALALNGDVPWQTLALQVLVLGMVPALLTHLLLAMARRYLPPNLFIYTLLNGFFGAALATGAAILALTASIALGDSAGWQQLVGEYLRFLPLVLMPEAILNGFVVVVLAVNRPHWLATFDERRYYGLS
ncbi:MAG: energy-coupling factor ABC transporter permease [Gammaproteobacteria bacterium]